MLNQHRPQPGRMELAFAGAMQLLPAFSVDAERAPVTFGWWLYANDRFVGRYHLETLYRLDRVGVRPGDSSGLGKLKPSEHFGQSTVVLRELLRVQVDDLLPRAPAGHHWIGPQLVQEVPCTVVHVPAGAGKLRGLGQDLPCDPKARLEFARSLAHRILLERVGA